MTNEFTVPDMPRKLPETIALSEVESSADEEQEFTLNSIQGSGTPAEGRYELRGEIARGGMGVVISAYDKLLQREVAIKLLLSKFRNNPQLHQRFIEEALLASCLQHPSVVPIYDRGYTLDNRPFFVMKLICGAPLSSILADAQRRQMERLQLLRCFEQICQTVSYAHTQGILHLDIKPSNIMIGDFGEVLLMDWGQAKSWKPIHPTHQHNENGAGLVSEAEEQFHTPLGTGGTPAYMSPEHARGEPVSPASDIFSLGALLCEILLGRPPYRSSNPKHVFRSAIKCNTIEVLRDLESIKCDGQLVKIVKQCLAKNPADRPANAQVVARSIAKFLETAVEQAESDRCRFFDLTLDMFCIATLEGRFVRINVNFSKVLGYSEQVLLSQPFLNFVHPDDRARTMEVMKELLQGKPVIQFCNRYRHADGSYLIFEWTAQSLPNEGNIFAVARDVTHRQVHQFGS